VKHSQETLRIWAAEAALKKQERDEGRDHTPLEHLAKTRKIRERELGKQKSGWGGGSDVMKKNPPPEPPKKHWWSK
jgi:hypothetical protein